jgi:hypothetical protein
MEILLTLSGFIWLNETKKNKNKNSEQLDISTRRDT